MSVGSFEVGGVVYDIVPRAVDPRRDPRPLDVDTVVVAGRPYPLAAVDPTRGTNPAGADYPGCRGLDQLVAYTPSGLVTPTNRFGVEVPVAGGKALAVVDRQAMGVVAGTPIPQMPGSYVLSGHGKARDWLLATARAGAVVELVKRGTPAPPEPTPTGRQLSVYLKMWTNNRLPGLAAAAVPGITEVRLAFLQGFPPRLVGWGSQDMAGVARDAQALRDRGVAVTASIGGAGGAVDLKSREAFLGGVAAAHAQIGMDRIDFDVEASALVAADVLAVAQAAHDRWGIASTMAPNGSNVSSYLPVAVELHKRGLLVAYGNQFYDAPVSLDAAKGRIAEAVRAGLPPSVIQAGTMVGNDSRHWSMDTCEANLRSIRAQWPDIAGAYLWSEGHSEVAEWARRMAACLV